MTNDNATPEDLKATAEAKAEELKEGVKTRLNAVADAFKDATLQQKLLAFGAAALVAALAVRKVKSSRKTAQVEEITVLNYTVNEAPAE